MKILHKAPVIRKKVVADVWLSPGDYVGGVLFTDEDGNWVRVWQGSPGALRELASQLREVAVRCEKRA